MAILKALIQPPEKDMYRRLANSINSTAGCGTGLAGNRLAHTLVISI